MPRTFFIFTLLVITLLIAGCNPPSTPEPLKTPTIEVPTPGNEWTITMNHSGGIMGLMRSIEVSSDGKFTVMDNRAEKTISGELSADELSKINEQVMSFKYIPVNKPEGVGCADCFMYDLEILANGKRTAIRLNDISLSNSGLEPLITQLRGLMETALK
jgi:hypothetical protein